MNSIFNGRKVFDPDKDELSISMVAKELGVSTCTVRNHIYNGRLKTFRKGHYHVITRAELNKYLQEKPVHGNCRTFDNFEDLKSANY